MKGENVERERGREETGERREKREERRHKEERHQRLREDIQINGKRKEAHEC